VGKEPVAPYQHEAFRTRPGSWIAKQGIEFEDVMVERFQNRLGRVHMVNIAAQ
jgi:phthalate 4,5-dioxygenase oxygenase subunit